MAQKAANLDRRPGRSWRPLLDTAVTASLNGRGQAGLNWRGSADYYYEGALIWLEADVLIRQKTGGKRSLDDFCRRFFGGAGGKPDVQPYTADDVFAMLDEIAPHDWKAFFTTRLESTAPHAPLDGLTQAGWTICYGDAKGLAGRSDFDLSYSLGIRLSTDGTLTEVGLDTVAAKAGLAPGMKVIAVDGRRWTATLLPEALDLAKERDRPLELLMEVDDVVKTVRVDYRGGDRQPRLEREAGRPDLLAEILKPLVRTQK
jgi:predicted metalloprotease with PDZ domain